MRPRTDRPRPRARRGVALLLVLGVLAALAWVSAEIVLESRRQMAEQGAFTRRGALRAEAWSATEAAVAVLRERALVDGAVYAVPGDMLPALTAGGYAPARGLEVRVEAEDLSGKYGLGALGDDALRDLLTDLGVPFDEASALAAGMLSVAHPARRGGREDTAREIPLAPGHAPVDWLDFHGVPGFAKFFKNADGSPNTRFAELAACVSLSGAAAQPNLNSASPALLRHLVKRGVLADAAALERRLAGPDGVRGTADDRFAKVPADLEAAGCGPVDKEATLTASRIRIHTTVRLGEGAFRLTADFDPQSGGLNFPWKITDRQERVAPR